MSGKGVPGRGLAAVAALAAGCTPALGQWVTTEVTVFSGLTFAEVDWAGNPVANPNGVLEPGERALLRLSAWYTPQAGAVVGYTQDGVARTGTLRGLVQGMYDIVGSGGTAGNWELGPVEDFWDLFPDPTGWGAVAPDRQGVRDVIFGQIPGTDHFATTNPILNVWRCVWTPESYEPRQVTFATAAASVSGGHATTVLLRTSPPGGIPVWCPSAFGSVGFAVVPGPGVVALVVAGVPLAARRRRR
jgi:hypothetical protein